MNCPRCGNNILPNENSCSKCGLIFINSNNNLNPNLNNNNINKINNINQNSNTIINEPNNQPPINNEPINLEGYYIGKNYNKIKKNKISWNTLIFGFLYTLYRKLILISLIWIAVDIASIYIMGKYSIFVIIGLNIVMSFLFNFIYLALTDNKVNNIKRKYWGHSIDELIYRCSQKGGTSTLPLFFFGFGFVVSCIVAFLLYLAFYPQYYVDKLYYRIPSDFDNVANEDDSYSLYQYSNNVNFCSIEAKVNNDYESIDQYVESKTENYAEENIKISKENILGREWTLIDAASSQESKIYYYVTEKDGILYSYEYNIYQGFGGECDKYYNYVKYSMTVR